MAKKNRKYYGEKHKALRKKISIEREKYIQEIGVIIYKVIKKYKNTNILEEKALEEIIELVWEFLTKVYGITSYELKQIYKEVPEFSIENLQDFLYNKDGKTLEDRIEEYYYDIPKYLNKTASEVAEDVLTASESFLYHIDLTMTTEAQNIETAVKKNKVPLSAGMLIIEAGCGDLCQGGEFAIDENVDLPPFHPNCQCIWYYDETDDEDEAHDLDLEVDEV